MLLWLKDDHNFDIFKFFDRFPAFMICAVSISTYSDHFIISLLEEIVTSPVLHN